jgi:hypothetical protein
MRCRQGQPQLRQERQRRGPQMHRVAPVLRRRHHHDRRQRRQHHVVVSLLEISRPQISLVSGSPSTLLFTTISSCKRPSTHIDKADPAAVGRARTLCGPPCGRIATSPASSRISRPSPASSRHRQALRYKNDTAAGLGAVFRCPLRTEPADLLGSDAITPGAALLHPTGPNGAVPPDLDRST